MAQEWNLPAWDSDEDIKEAKESPLDMSLDYGLQQNPESHAQLLKSAEQIDLPIGVVEGNQEEANRLAKQKEVMKRLDEGSSELKQAFENPDFAAVAHDDVDNLVTTENIFKLLKLSYMPLHSPGVQTLTQFAESGAITTLDTAKETAIKAPQRYMAGLAEGVFNFGESAATIMDAWAQADRDISAALGYDLPEGEHTLEKLSATLKGAGDMPLYESPMLRSLIPVLDEQVKEFEKKGIKGKGAAEIWREGAIGSTKELEYALGGVESFGAMTAGTIGSVATGTAAPALIAGFAQESGAMGKQMREAGYGPYTTFAGAGMQGTIEVLTERLPQLKLLENLKLGTGFGKMLVSQYLVELPQEQVATALQDLNELIYLRPEATFGDYMAERPAAAYQTLIAAATGTTLHTASSYGTVKVLERLTGQSYPEALGDMSRAQMALRNEGTIEMMERLAADSKLRERHPGVYQQHLDNAKEKAGADHTYIDGESFFQTLEDNDIDIDDVARAIPSIADQLEYVREQGGTDFQIPIEEWMTKVAGTEVGEALIEHVRFHADDMSAAQAREWMDSAQERLLEDTDEILDKLDIQQEFIDSANRVEEYVRNQLEQSGRVTKDVAKKDAALWKAFATTVSYRNPQMFSNPEAVLKRYGLKVAGEPLAGIEGFDQLTMPTSEVMNYLTDKPRLPQEKAQRLQQSMKAKGVVNPVVLVDWADGSTTLEDGNQRTMNAYEAGIEDMNVVRLKQSPGESELDMLSRVLEEVDKQEDVLYQEVPTETDAFKQWFGDSKVVDEQGEPLVVYHGTTHDIEAFTPERANIENDFGVGYYFTNNEDDVSANYAGEGPDLTQRIERLAERIEQDEEIEMDEARDKARAQLFGGAPNVMPVYLSIQNPAILGGDNETYIEGIEIDEETGDETGEGVELYEAIIRSAAGFEEADGQQIWEDIDAYYGISARDLQRRIKESEGAMYMTDEEGNLAASEFARRVLEEMGYDGIIDNTVDVKFGSQRARGKQMEGMDYDTTHYIAFNPEQIKSQFNVGTFDPADPRILYQEQPTFFSGLEKAVSGLKQEKGSAQQFLAQIKKTPGVKQEEIEWLGLEEYLAGKEKITKQEILDFVQQNGVQVEEVEKGGEKAINKELEQWINQNRSGYPQSVADWIDLADSLENIAQQWQRNGDDNQANKYFNWSDEANRAAESLETPSGDVIGATKFSQWQLPGGENYRELLLTLPDIEPRNLNDIAQELYGKRFSELNDEEANKAAGQEAREKKAQNFKSSHFDEPNILAHVRFNERTDADGKKVLFIEEVQSDWHQKGRKEGYAQKKYAVHGGLGQIVLKAGGKGRAIFDTLAEAEEYASNVPDWFVKETDYGAVPDAPFKTTWPLLAMKRMIRYAVDNGFDSVAWTTGEQQAERYNLANYVETIKHTKNGDGTYNLYVIDKEGKDVLDRLDIPEDELENLIGKEMAQKIVNREGEPEVSEALQGILDRGRGLEVFNGEMITLGKGKYSNSVGLYYKDNRIKDFEPTGGITQEQGERYLDRIKNSWFIAYEDGSVAGTYVNEGDAQRAMDNINREYFDSPDENQRRVLSGLDLKVGGEGMKAFYDKMLPSMVNKYVKKWGAKVGETKLNVNNLPQEEKYTRYPESHPFSKANFPTVHAFDITDPMRESVMEGQALFQEKRGKIQFPQDITQAPSVISLLENADLSTFLHESGHFFFEIYRDIASQPNASEQVFQDMDALVKFAGVQSLDEWNQMSLEQRRAGHEKVAEAFEVYLFEGKAPSVELQSLFQTFRAWLVSAYKQLRQYLSPDKITDEVRGVFDRMLATDEAITYAERARGFTPAFETKEQAGATDEQWEQYQRSLEYAHEGAIEEVQARSMKDMQWLAGAKSRELKKLQSKANSLRRAVKEEATKEIQDKPVYRVMYLLKHGKYPDTEAPGRAVKLDSEALKAMYGGPEAQKSDPNIVNPKIDDLMTAIAKLGGISQEEAEAQGIDPANWKGRSANTINQPVFRKRVFRKDGHSFDGMAEKLRQYGYQASDVNDLLNRVDDSLMGDTQYSHEADYDLLFGEEPQKIPWQKLVQGKMAEKGGVHPDIIAPLFGFDSGDAMVKAILSAPSPAEAINELTDRRMLERHGDLSNPVALQEAADSAVHNLARARVIATEARFLSRLAGSPAPSTKVAKAAAERLLGDMQVKDIKPSRFESEERKASKAVRDAWKDGDYARAARQAQRQLLNFHLAKQARDIVSETEKNLQYVKKFDKASIRKNIDPDQLDQIDDLRKGFDFRKSTTLKEIAKRESLNDWVARQEEAGYEPAVDVDLMEEIKRKHYKTLTAAEMRGLIDGIKNIEHIGRLKKKLLTALDKREFAERMAQAKESIAKNARKVVAEKPTPSDAAGRTLDWLKGFFADHRKVASIIREMDGVKDGGTLWELYLMPMNEAGDKETHMRAEASKRMAQLFDPIARKISKGGLPANILAQKRVVPGTNISLTYEQRIMFGMNWGNLGNRQRLLDGGLSGKREMSMTEAQAILNSLDEQDWNFIQGVWDFIAEYKPQIAEQERKLTGITPEWVEPAPVETKYGIFQGGYFPAKYDAMLSERAAEIEASIAIREGMKGAFNSSATRKSYTQKRAEEVKNRPLLLSFDAVTQHVNEVVHRLSWQDWLTDANRILKSLEPDIREHYGPEIYHQLKDAKQDIAVGETVRTTNTERLINHVRIGTTIQGMGYRLTTAMLQPTGIAQGVARVGSKWIAMGVGRYVWNPLAASREANKKSTLMDIREKTFQREVNEIMNVARAGKGITAISGSYFMLLYKMQRAVDLPVWWGAYEKALAQLNMENAVSQKERDIIEKKAVAMADQAVLDSQGGGQVKDLAKIQRGGAFMKMWTNFYSYFNTTYNLNVEAFKKTHFNKPSEVAMLAVDLIVLNIIPVVLSVAIREAMQGRCEDEECIAQKLAKEQASYLFGQMVILRELGSIADYFITGKGYGYQGPPGIRAIGETYKFGQQVAQGEADAAFWRSASALGGILLHLPTGQIYDTADGLIAISNGETDTPIENAQALMTGAPKD